MRTKKWRKKTKTNIAAKALSTVIRVAEAEAAKVGTAQAVP